MPQHLTLSNTCHSVSGCALYLCYPCPVKDKLYFRARSPFDQAKEAATRQHPGHSQNDAQEQQTKENSLQKLATTLHPPPPSSEHVAPAEVGCWLQRRLQGCQLAPLCQTCIGCSDTQSACNCRAASVSERSEANDRVLFKLPLYLQYIYIYIYIYVRLSGTLRKDVRTLRKSRSYGGS